MSSRSYRRVRYRVMLHRTYRSVRYRYWCCTELTEVSGTGIDAVPNFPKCPVPVLMSDRTYRSVWYRYWFAEVTEVSGTTNTGDTAGMPRYLPCRTHPWNVAYQVCTCAIFLGFYCSMDTWRIIRVGTRVNIIRIAAVSQEHVPVCITRKRTQPENDMVLVLPSKSTWLLCGWSK